MVSLLSFHPRPLYHLVATSNIGGVIVANGAIVTLGFTEFLCNLYD